MTEENRNKFLHEIRLGRTDEEYFIKNFLGLPVHPGQSRWFKYAHKLINLLTPGNKWGKTSSVACRHIWKNFYKVGAEGDPEDIARVEYQTLAISPIGGQSARTQQYIEQILNSSFSWVNPDTKQRMTNNCKIGWFFHSSVRGDGSCVRYINGGRTDIRSVGDDKGSKLQGNDWYYISYDEWTRSYHLDEELDANIIPRLTVYGGSLDLLGTPDMESQSLQTVNDLLEEARHDKETYYYQGGSMNENIFFPEENKQRIIRGVRDKEKLKQIIEGEIVITGGRLFTTDMISKVWIPGGKWSHEDELRDAWNLYLGEDFPLEKRITEINGYVYKFPPMVDGYKVGKYVIAMDWHLSEGGDETVIYVIRYDIIPHEIYYYLATKKGNPYMKHDKVRNLHEVYNKANLVVDSQGVGKQLSYDLEDLEPVCFDSVSTGKEKSTMITILKNYLSYKEGQLLVGKFRSPFIKNLSKQLGTYKLDDKKIKQDYVMALGVAAWWIQNEGVVIDLPPDKRS